MGFLEKSSLIITTKFNNKMMKELIKIFKIEHHNSPSYLPKMNEVAEVANKNIKKII